MTFLAATVLFYHINDTFCLHTARIRFYFPSIVDDTFSLLLCGFSWAQKNRCLVASVSDFIFNSIFQAILPQLSNTVETSSAAWTSSSPSA